MATDRFGAFLQGVPQGVRRALEELRRSKVAKAGDTMTGPLTIAVSNDVNTSDGSGGLQVGPNGALNIGIDGNEIQARSGGAVSSLILNNEGGLVAVGPANLRFVWDPTYLRLYTKDYRQFIRGVTETSGSTLVPMLQSGRIDAVFSNSSAVTGSTTFPNAFGATPNVVAVAHCPSSSGNYVEMYTNIYTVSATGFSWRLVNPTLAISVTAYIQWMAFGRLSA